MPHTFHINQNISPNQEVSITGDQARHLGKVLRVQSGEVIHLVDPFYKLYLAHIKSVLPDGVVAEVKAELPPPPKPYPIYLCLALLKREKMEWVIEKAVELNVAGVFLVKTKRCVRDELSPNKWQRLQKISEESLKQCGRLIPLELKQFESFEDLLAYQKGNAQNVFCDELLAQNPTSKFTQIKSEALNLWVGPEGGWDDSEREWAKKKGFTFVSLAPLVLRAETAALHALSMAIICFKD